MTSVSKYADQLRHLGFTEYQPSDPKEAADFEIEFIDEEGEEVFPDAAAFCEGTLSTLPCFFVVEFGSVAEGLPAFGTTMAFDENGNAWVHDKQAVEVNRFIPEFTPAGIPFSVN